MKNIPKKIIYLRAGLIFFLLTASISFAKDSPPVKKVNIYQGIQKGIALYDKGEYEAALKYFIELDTSYPDSGNILYEIAITFYALKDYKSALKFAEDASEMLPEVDKVYILLGNIYDNLNNPEEAVKKYNKAIQVNPESDSAHFNLGVAYYNNKNYTEAEKALNASLKFNENNASTQFVLGFVYIRLNETELAKSTFRKFLDIEKKGKRAEEVRRLLKTIILNKDNL